MLVFQNKEMAAMMVYVYQTNPPGIELYFLWKYLPLFQKSKMAAGHVSESALLISTTHRKPEYLEMRRTYAQ